MIETLIHMAQLLQRQRVTKQQVGTRKGQEAASELGKESGPNKGDWISPQRQVVEAKPNENLNLGYIWLLNFHLS